MNLWSKREDAKLQSMCADGASTREMSRKLKRAETAVDRRISYLRGIGVDMPRRGNPPDEETDEAAAQKACELHLQDLRRAYPERVNGGVMTDFYALSKSDNWTPADGHRRALSKTVRPVVRRESLMSYAERAAIAERAKAAAEEAEPRAIRRREAMIAAMERRREEAQKELEAAEAHALELARRATYGKLWLIASEVAREHGVDRVHLRAEGQSRQSAAVRGEAAWRMWNEISPKPSFPAMGKALNRHYSTIIHAIAVYAGPRNLPMPPCCVNRYAKELKRKKDGIERRTKA